MKTLCCLLLFLFTSPLLAVEPVVTVPVQVEEEASTAVNYLLTAEMWARPRSGEAVLAMPPLREVVQQLIQTPGSHLLLRYPGGDEGSIWAEELQGWLISLGIEPTLIEMRPGSTPGQIELQLISTARMK